MRFYATAIAATVFATTTLATADGIAFVDDDAALAGDGRSWSTAYRHLQDALDDAADPTLGITEIRLAGGTYYPDADAAHPDGTGDRDSSFWLADGVAVLGGFAGAAAIDPNHRDLAQHETILSGDLLGNDGPDFLNYEDNSRHVLVGQDLDRETHLDGLTVYGGNTQRARCCSRGGGMRTARATLLISDCIFTGNLGAGAPGGQGGAIYLATSVATIERTSFLGNHAVAGGALYIRASDAFIADSLFDGNSAGNGGAVHTFEQGAVEFARCDFLRNEATVGGGAAVVQGSGPTLFRASRFERNAAGGFGGAVQMSHTTSFEDSDFRANTATYGAAVHNRPALGRRSEALLTGSTLEMHPGGGVIFNDAGFDGDPRATLANSLVARNDTAAIVNWGEARATILSSTLADNARAVENTIPTAHVDIANSILWSGGAYAEAEQILGGSATVRGTCVRWSGSGLNDGNIALPPAFAAPADGDFRLAFSSPCIDRGDNSALPHGLDHDLDGNRRIARGRQGFATESNAAPRIDMGAYEVQ